MSGFLYFLPNAKPSDVPANLKLWGLSYLIEGEGRNLWARGCTINGAIGLVVGSSANWQVEEVKAGDHLEWAKFPKPFAEIPPMLGWLKDQPMPGPADLARQKQISGEHHHLADGNRWLLPIAKQYTGEGHVANLPLCFGLDEETGGWIANSIVPQYRAIWNHANAYLMNMMQAYANASEDGTVQWIVDNSEELVEDAFQANYRVSSMEIATLGLLVSGLVKTVADVLCDAKGFTQIKKKVDNDTGLG